MNHGLSDKTVSQIGRVLARFPEVETAVLFGSRAKGTHKPGSDIDLALTGHAVDLWALGRIDDALDDLMLPYRFSLVNLDKKTDQDLVAHIERVGIPFFQRHTVVGKH